MFSKRIFRDIENVDYMKHKLAVIFRVMRYWNREDFVNLKKVYSLNQLNEFINKRWKELDDWEKQLLSLLMKQYV